MTKSHGSPAPHRESRKWVTLSTLALLAATVAIASHGSRQPRAALALDRSGGRATREGACPPFHLLDEDGLPIDPLHSENADRPYSPARTCGECHDYAKITSGYHFRQGAGEDPTADQAARCQWALTPGNYGGTWCSPAPLYRYLSPKRNESRQTMDMTSFSFITDGCGGCHPGGGSAEYDREGKRYDRWMADPASGFAPGGENGFDGDYHRARWSETGVLEADCMICHLPGYDMAERKRQLKALNFRWAATAAGGFAEVAGSVAKNEPVRLRYDAARFNSDGTVSPHIVREPRNEACLFCHAKPGWKKRGTDFRARTDVHLRAGLRCVDCHPAGESALDPRIRDREQHQIGKGDDPGGHVRDDLDNTARDCADCHASGSMGAPITKHVWLPPIHLDRIACQTCHIPERSVKAALVQAGDVFNPGARIPTKGKHLWTFYDPDMRYWNHYGDLEMMGYDDKPTDSFRPRLALYKGKIYPVNRVHSAWPAIRIDGFAGLTQPKMGDIYAMWAAHRKDPAAYPQLARIRDDNGDTVPEVNRPEEIDALIASVTEMLRSTAYPMDRKHVVWVMDDRVYASGARFETLPMEPWEASPYGNVHKYSHGVRPAAAALGAGGCTDCHNPSSDFFFAPVVRHAFDAAHAEPVYEPQYRLLGLSGFWARLGAWREFYGKPALYGLLGLLVCGLVVLGGQRLSAWAFENHAVPVFARLLPWVSGAAVALLMAGLTTRPALMAHMLPTRLALDSHHAAAAVAVLLAGGWALALRTRERAGGRRTVWDRELVFALLLVVVTGVVVFFGESLPDGLMRAGHALFDLGLVLLLAGTVATVFGRAARQARNRSVHTGRHS